MLLEIGAGCEALVAMRAEVRLLSRVDPLVSDKITDLFDRGF